MWSRNHTPQSLAVQIKNDLISRAGTDHCKGREHFELSEKHFSNPDIIKSLGSGMYGEVFKVNIIEYPKAAKLADQSIKKSAIKLLTPDIEAIMSGFNTKDFENQKESKQDIAIKQVHDEFAMETNNLIAITQTRKEEIIKIENDQVDKIIGYNNEQGSFGHDNVIELTGWYIPSKNVIKGEYCRQTIENQPRDDAGKREFSKETIMPMLLTKPILATPFYDRGDIRNYLRTLPLQQKMYVGDIIRIFYECAAGLSFLKRSRIIHRDISAKNIMLQSVPSDKLNQASKSSKSCLARMRPRIIDFGLARVIKPGEPDELVDSDGYMMKTNRKLPLPYLAIEAFKAHPPIFSFASDVWGLGVALWEISVYCKLDPYNKVRGEKLQQQVLKGKRLQIRNDLPKELQKLMQNCWLENDKKRINCKGLQKELKKLLDNQKLTEETEKNALPHEVPKHKGCALL